jgi:hypothetical protein
MRQMAMPELPEHCRTGGNKEKLKPVQSANQEGQEAGVNLSIDYHFHCCCQAGQRQDLQVEQRQTKMW